MTRRFAVADLVVVAAEALDLDPATVLDLIDLDAAARALADPEPPASDPAARAGALLHGLLEHRPLPRGNRRVAVLATAQFLALDGWRVDLEPAEELVRVLRVADGPTALARWLRPRISSAAGAPAAPAAPTRATRRKGRAVFGGKRDEPEALGRLDDRARRVVVLAREEARFLRHNWVGTEHLLLGLIHEGEGAAARTLRACHVDVERVRTRLYDIAEPGRDVPAGHIPFTPRSERALDLATAEAGAAPARTEHVLLGVLREGGGIGAAVLGEFGLDPVEIRERVLEVAGAGSSTAEADAAVGAAPDPAEENARLRDEVRRLRSRLHDAGIDPDTGAPRSA